VDGVVEVSAGGRARAVRGGETFGEEAFVPSLVVRRGDARAIERATVAAIPGALLRRVVERGHSRGAERVARAMLRAAAGASLRASRLGGACAPAEIDVLLDAAEHRHVERGERVFGNGGGDARIVVVASGLVREERAGAGVVERAYLGPGEVLEGSGEASEITAAGPSWLLALAPDAVRDVLARAPELLRDARRAREELLAAGRTIDRASRGRPNVMGDLSRFQLARSLLVLDQESCVRCGHCAWSCATAHDDGVSRLVRRGDVVLAGSANAREPPRALLLATSCQHCAAPACLPACPTGAITMGAHGDVVLRESLCTGCGACAKACPWDAVQMVPRVTGGGSVAVKCDLCAGTASGPACVSACPTEALARVVPTRELPEVGAALGATELAVPPPRPTPGWPFAAIGVGLAAVVGMAPLSRGTSGVVAGLALAVLGAHAVWKRLVRRFGRAAYVAHVATAPVAMAAVARHAGLHAPAGAAGALVWMTVVAFASGAAGALAYALAPRRLARLESAGALPEDLPVRAAEIEARSFAELSGKRARVKAAYSHLVRPYATAPLGALALLVRGADPIAEERRLRARIERTLAGRPAPLEGLDELVRLAIASRALRAQRWLHVALRAWLPVHVVAAAAALALLVVHILVVVAFR
jgi:Fe-S-cluster-containing dehydrogenase component